MADADFSVKAVISAQTSQFEKGIKNAQSSINSMSKSVNKLPALFKKAFAVGGVVGGAIATLKVLNKTIKETTEAYRKQLKAEISLSTAIKNSVNVSTLATKRLKDFASTIQKTSDYGDEELIPMMSRLIASGRTEAETMKIIQTATDIASSGAMSFDSAIEQLNATMNGNIGRLGRQYAELQNLTKEELKAGRAVDILAGKYKGMAQETADTSKRLKNAIGDFKELIGQSFEENLSPMRKFFAELIEKQNEAIKKARELKKAQQADPEQRTPEQIQMLIDEETAKLSGTRKELFQLREQIRAVSVMTNTLQTEVADSTGARMRVLTKEITEAQNRIGELKKQLSDIKAEEKAEAERIKAENAKAEEAQKQKTLNDLMDEYTEKLAKQNQIWQYMQDSLQEAVTDEERLTFYQDALVDLMDKTNGQIDEGSDFYQEQIDRIQELIYLINKRKAEEKKARLKARYEQMEEDYKELMEGIKRHNKEQTKEMLKNMANFANTAVSVISSAFKTITNIVKSAFSVLKSLVKLNLSDSLDTLLAFEDSVLTFFVETLPKLPSYVASALQSIRALLDNLSANLNVKQLTQIFNDIIQNLVQELPNIIIKITNIATTIVTALADALITNLPTIAEGLATMREQVIPKIEEMLGKLIEAFGGILETLLPEAIKFILEFIFMIAKKLPSLISAIVEAIPEIITAILEEIPKFFEEDFPTIVAEFIKLVPTLIKVAMEIVVEIIKHFGEIVVAIIKGLIKAFAETNWIQVVIDIFTAFIDAIKNLFGIHSPSTLFAEFGENMLKGLWEGLKNMGSWLTEKVTGFFTGIWDSIKNVFSGAGEWFGNVFGGIGNSLSNWASNTWETTKNIASGVGSTISGAVSGAVQGVKNIASNIGSTVGNVASTVGNFFSSLKFWADGTNSAPRGLAVVGEAGPELVRFNGGEQVLNAKNTQKALAGAGGNTNNFNVTFNNLQDTTAFAMMQQLKNYNRQLAINGVF